MIFGIVHIWMPVVTSDPLGLSPSALFRLATEGSS